MNIKSTRRAFGPVLFTSRVRCHVHVLPERRRVLGVWSTLSFIIKRTLGIKRIFPCSFGNKRMRLLTRVYGRSLEVF